MSDRSLPDGHEDRSSILAELLDDSVSAQAAAETLAAVTLEDGSLESGLNVTWGTIIITTRMATYDGLGKLATMLSDMASLPPPTDPSGQHLTVYEMRVWNDLPMLGWEFNDEWNGLSIPTHDSQRKHTISSFININKLAALLMQTRATVFASFDIFALWTFRSALETPIDQATAEDQPPEAFIPSAAAWISTIGAEIYPWNKQFPFGGNQGDPGRGGPLCHEETHGFSKERWQFWQQRFGEIAISDQLSDNLKAIAKDAEAQMLAIEADAG